MVACQDALVPLSEWRASHFVCFPITTLPEFPAILVWEVAVARGTPELSTYWWRLRSFGGSRGGCGWCFRLLGFLCGRFGWSLAGGDVIASEQFLSPLGSRSAGHFVCNPITALPELPTILVWEIAIARGTSEAFAWLLGGSC